jgi:hypothetical protein
MRASGRELSLTVAPAGVAESVPAVGVGETSSRKVRDRPPIFSPC